METCSALGDCFFKPETAGLKKSIFAPSEFINKFEA